YLRRVGRTARGGARGCVLSFAAGTNELKISKQITAAAIRNIPLANSPADLFAEQVRCLERFDPMNVDWRAPEASAPKPMRAQMDEAEVAEAATKLGGDDAEMDASDWRRAFDEDDEMSVVNGKDDEDYDDRNKKNRKGNDSQDNDRKGWKPWKESDEIDNGDDYDPEWIDDASDNPFGMGSGVGIGLTD
ncbi:unnamed protein product, partial [Polarella glacialis]